MPASHTVFIDDSLPNIQGAQALGIHAIHYYPDLNLPQVMESYLETE
jgi:FMN phosphatase YigB (HAD superfamily)